MEALPDLNDINTVFNKIQQYKACYQYLSLVRLRLLEDDDSDVSKEREVLSYYLRTLSHAVRGEDKYISEEGGKSSIRSEYNEIDYAVGLTPEQRQKIKNDYLALLPFLNDDPALDGDDNNNNNGYGGPPSPLGSVASIQNNYIPPALGGRRLRKRSKKTRKASKKSRRNRKSRRV